MPNFISFYSGYKDIDVYILYIVVIEPNLVL